MHPMYLSFILIFLSFFVSYKWRASLSLLSSLTSFKSLWASLKRRYANQALLEQLESLESLLAQLEKMSNLTTSTSGNATLRADPQNLCTLALCDLSLARVNYLPSLGGNALYASLFGTFIIAQVYLGIKHRTWGFMIAMFFGLLGEVIGYVARIMMNSNPFSKPNFLTYLICLTIAPALLSAGIYLCLARIVVAYGEHISRFRPRTYTFMFCGFDFLSLLLQAIGGAIASTATTYDKTQTGIHIMMAGLSVQVVSLAAFAFFCIEFALRLSQNPRSWSQKHQHIYSSKIFSLFLIGLSVATFTIFVRSTFRVAELSGGFHGPLANDQVSFMILEGAMIVIACLCLTCLHPGVTFQGAWHEADFNFRNGSWGGDDVKSLYSLEPHQTAQPEYAVNP